MRLLHISGMDVRGYLLGTIAVCLIAGCKPSQVGGQQTSVGPGPGTTNQTNAVVGRRDQIHLDHAQPRLQTVKLWLGAEELVTEAAVEPVQVATGMMFRESMPENEGMIFVFPIPHQTSFYMKNTKVPLSAAYIGADGTILEIHDLHPYDESPVPSESDQIQFVLEVNQGWFKRHNIHVGTVIRTEYGTLKQTFLPRNLR